MPASPYTFQRGVGFVSPPSQFPIFSFLGGLGGSRNANEQQRSDAESKIDNFDESDRSSDSNSSPGLFQNLLSDSKASLLKRHNDDDVANDDDVNDVSDSNDAPSTSFSDAIKNLLLPAAQKEIIRPDIKFVSNGRPFNVFELGSLFKTTEVAPTTTTTTTTTTTSTTTEEVTEEAVTEGASEDKVDSPITWLGKFMLNGLPTKIFDFKSPFASFDWFDSLKEIKSTNLFMSLFK